VNGPAGWHRIAEDLDPDGWLVDDLDALVVSLETTLARHAEFEALHPED